MFLIHGFITFFEPVTIKSFIKPLLWWDTLLRICSQAMVPYLLFRMNLYSLSSGSCVLHRWNKQAMLSGSSGLLFCCLFHLKFYFPLFNSVEFDYPSRHLPNYIFSQVFQVPAEHFPIVGRTHYSFFGTQNLWFLSSFLLKLLQYISFGFFAPKAWLCVPLTFKKVFYNQLSSVILNMNLKGQHEEWNRNGWFCFLHITNKNA